MNITCDEIVISNVRFERNLDFEGEAKDLEISIEPEYGISEQPQDRISRLRLRFSAGEEGSDDFPFFCSVEVIGVFSWDGWDDEEAEKLVSSQGMQLVMSFVRSKFYSLQKDAGLDPVVLPSMEFEA